MATVVIPAGMYKLDLIDGAIADTDLALQGPNPIVIEGAGAARTTLVEYVGAANPSVCATGSRDRGLCSPCRHASSRSCYLKNILAVRENGSRVENLTLDTRSYDAGSGLQVVANDTTVSGVLVTHGAAQNANPHFPVVYGGRPGASHADPLYHSGNVVNGLAVSDRECDDGISFSFQQNATINNLSYSGSRIALYIDDTVTVTNFTYAPGPQKCDTRQGFWITSPSRAIQITNYRDMAAPGSGAGGGVIGTTIPTAAYSTSDVTLSGYQVGAKVGAVLRLANASDVSITAGSGACRLGGTNWLAVAPTNGVVVTGIHVTGCQFASVVVTPATAGGIQGLVLTDETFSPSPTQRAVFTDMSGIGVQVTVSGGQLIEDCGRSIPLRASSQIHVFAGSRGLPAVVTGC